MSPVFNRFPKSAHRVFRKGQQFVSVMRQFLIVAILGAIAAVGYLVHDRGILPFGKQAVGKTGGKSSGNRGRRAMPVRTAPAVLETFRTHTEAVGTTRALRTVEIVPLSAGRLRSIAIKSGKFVRSGEVLAQLDNDIQVADLAEATAKLDEARRAHARAKELFDKRNVTEALVIELRAKLAAANADRDRAKRRLADRTVRAPFAGRIGLRQVDLGARVDTDTVLTTLDDLSEIEIEAPISEIHFPSISEGATVTAESAAFPDRTFAGKIAAVDVRIDPVGRAFRIRIRIPNADGALPSGMFMRVSLVLEERTNPAVPEQAIVVRAGEKFVFVVDGDTVGRTPVQTGQRRDGLVEIVSGIRPGAVVVTEGTQRLRDGVNIRIISDSANLLTSPVHPTANVSGTRKQDGG